MAPGCFFIHQSPAAPAATASPPTTHGMELEGVVLVLVVVLTGVTPGGGAGTFPPPLEAPPPEALPPPPLVPGVNAAHAPGADDPITPASACAVTGPYLPSTVSVVPYCALYPLWKAWTLEFTPVQIVVSAATALPNAIRLLDAGAVGDPVPP